MVVSVFKYIWIRIYTTKVDTGASSNSSTMTVQHTIFAMAMALKVTLALPKVTAAVDGKDKVDLYCGNVSPVAPDFDNPLKWWRVSFFPLLPTVPRIQC